MIIKLILVKIKRAFTDLLPIILVIAFFQTVVLRQPLPHMGEVLFGALLVVTGLTLFVEGLEMGLFPIGESMAHATSKLFFVYVTNIHQKLFACYLTSYFITAYSSKYNLLM
ncbi:MAG: DUF1538 family protein, partial [Desulfobacterales bacterium]|nr:DUF1538 family protein [Desulfobacterales bacterium]